jgi:hypothetical protein
LDAVEPLNFAVPFFLAAAEDFAESSGAGRFFPATGAGVANGSVEDALDPAIDGSFFRVATGCEGCGVDT